MGQAGITRAMGTPCPARPIPILQHKAMAIRHTAMRFRPIPRRRLSMAIMATDHITATAAFTSTGPIMLTAAIMAIGATTAIGPTMAVTLTSSTTTAIARPIRLSSID